MNKISYHAGISNSTEVKRSLLEASRDVLKLMQAIDSLNSIRTEKIHTAINLNKSMQDIHLLIQKLKQELPRADTMVAQPKIAGSEPKMSFPVLKTEERVPIKPEVNPDEIHNIETQLAEIESRLNSLK